MIRGFVAGCRFGLLLLVVFAATELTLAIAAAGGWIRFAAGLLVATVAMLKLPAAIGDLVDDEVVR